MFVTYIAVASLFAAALALSATLDFVRFKPVLINMERAGVSQAWLPMLGFFKTAGALGLLVGIVGLPLIGTAAAVGVILFFLGAIITHIRVRDYSFTHGFALAIAFLLLAAATLVLGLPPSLDSD